jgi:hypothetical protein
VPERVVLAMVREKGVYTKIAEEAKSSST